MTKDSLLIASALCALIARELETANIAAVAGDLDTVNSASDVVDRARHMLADYRVELISLRAAAAAKIA